MSGASATRLAFERYRNYLRPSDQRGYRAVLRDLRARADPPAGAAEGRPSVLFDLTHPLIDKDKGRYAFNLVREFVDGGFTVHLARNYWFLSSFHRKAHKRLLLKEPVRLFEGPVEKAVFDLLVTDRAGSPLARSCTRTLSLDHRARLHRAPYDGVLFPYRPHPSFRTHPELPAVPDLADDARPIPVSFLGHWMHADYDNTRALAEFGVHGRRELIEALIGGLGPERQFLAQDAGATTSGAGRFVLGDDARLPDQRDYTRILRATNFFVCCPGTGHPMCHHLAESLLLGCIPIVQKPELTGLPLVDGENCCAFATPQGLVEVVRRCLELPQQRIEALRNALRPLVREHVEPGSFARSVMRRRDAKALSLFWFERAR